MTSGFMKRGLTAAFSAEGGGDSCCPLGEAEEDSFSPLGEASRRRLQTLQRPQEMGIILLAAAREDDSRHFSRG
jgi:hypothetical protein